MGENDVGFYGAFPESWSEEQKAEMRLIERGMGACVDHERCDDGHEATE